MPAILWLKPEDCDDVEVAEASIVYASSQTHYYVLHPSLQVTEWLPVDEFAEGEGWECEIVPFESEWFEVGDSVTVDTDMDEEQWDMVERQLEHLGLDWGELRLFGYIDTPQGRQEVRSGDWIIKEGNVFTSVIRDEQPNHQNA